MTLPPSAQAVLDKALAKFPAFSHTTGAHSRTIERTYMGTQMYEALTALAHDIAAAGVPADEWRCFHCDERFTDRGLAAKHFGYEGDEPACKLNEREGGLAAALHTAEKALHAYRNEDTQKDREYHALAARLTVVSREQEEKGYTRGLADGRTLSAPAVAVECLVDTMWQLLDDMGETGLCVCYAAKEQAHKAFAPFVTDDASLPLLRPFADHPQAYRPAPAVEPSDAEADRRRVRDDIEQLQESNSVFSDHFVRHAERLKPQARAALARLLSASQ